MGKRWPPRDGSPGDDGGEAFVAACLAELTSADRALTDEADYVYAYACVCGGDISVFGPEAHAASCDPLADFVREGE